MADIVEGSKVTADWGAMFPTVDGVVEHITSEQMCIIKWDSDNDQLQNFMIRIDEIHQPGWKSVNGSGIGIFIVK